MKEQSPIGKKDYRKNLFHLFWIVFLQMVYQAGAGKVSNPIGNRP